MHAHVICRYMAHEEDLFVSGNYYVVIISSYCGRHLYLYMYVCMCVRENLKS